VDYLTKPVSERALLDRVRHILDPGSAERVLVADDDPDVRRMLGMHLKRAGYTVLEAADGDEAEQVALKERPALVLMDIKMPRVSGLEALRNLRHNAATRDLPVVMMTASPGTLEASRSVIESLGGVMLLTKPHTAEDLARAIGAGLRAADK
jgi:DNA-binding response OmpR family regulator